MLKILSFLVVLVIGVIIFLIGISLVSRTEYTLRKMIEIVGIREKSFQYEFMTNSKNLIHYKIVGIIFILFSVLSIVLPILKTIFH